MAGFNFEAFNAAGGDVAIQEKQAAAQQPFDFSAFQAAATEAPADQPGVTSQLPGISQEAAQQRDVSLQEETGAALFRDERAAELVRKMHGRLQLNDEEFATLQKEAETEAASIPDTQGFQIPGITSQKQASLVEETGRRETAAQIKELGFADEDIASALAFERASLPPSKKAQFAAGAVAGIAIPAAINILIPGLAAAPEEIITGPLIARTLVKLGLRGAGVGAVGAAGAIADISLDPDRDLTVETAFESAKQGFIEEGITEVVFGAGEIGLARMFGRPGRMAADNVDELNELLQASAKRQGITQHIQLQPGQASQLPSAIAAEAIAESSLFGANPVAKTKVLVRKSSVSLVKDLPESMARAAGKLSAADVVELTREVIKGNETFHGKAAKALYARVDELVEEAGKRTTPVKKIVKTPAGKLVDASGKPLVKATSKEVIEQVPLKGRLANLEDVKKLGEEIRQEFLEAQDFGFEGQVKALVTKLQNVDEFTTFSGIQDMRSTALSLKRDLQRSGRPNTKLFDVIDRAIPVLDNTMEKSLDLIGGDAKRLLRRANEMWKANKEIFDDDVIKGILSRAADTNPDAVFKIINSADERQVGKLLAAIGEGKEGKVALGKIKSGYLAGMISDATDKADAFKVTGEREPFGNILLKRFEDIPDKVRSKIFTAREIKDIDDKFRLLTLSQKSGDTALVGLKAAQALGVVGILAAPFAEEKEGIGAELRGAGGLLVFGPSVLAALILRRPGFARALAEGTKVKAATREGVKLTARLGRMIIEERKRINKQRENIGKAAEKAERVEKAGKGPSKTGLDIFN